MPQMSPLLWVFFWSFMFIIFFTYCSYLLFLKSSKAYSLKINSEVPPYKW